MMDPELAAASALMERLEIADVETSRSLLRSMRNPTSYANDETAGRVTVSERMIDGADSPIAARIYAPTTGGLHPGVVFLHGGAFVMGDLNSEVHRCLLYAADASCVVVSVDYRLAPENRFPAGVEDGYSALRWVVEHAEELGVDSRRIAVAGSSAGGALAAALCLMARDRGAPQIAMQMLLYPVLDDRMTSVSMQQFDATPVWDRGNNAQMWEQYLGEDGASQYAAPARADDLTGLPPAYIMTAELDPLRDEAIEYALRLLRHGVSVELHQVAGAYHGFDDAVPDAAISRRAIADQVHHLRRVLRS